MAAGCADGATGGATFNQTWLARQCRNVDTADLAVVSPVVLVSRGHHLHFSNSFVFSISVQLSAPMLMMLCSPFMSF